MPEVRVGLLIPQYDCTIEQALESARAADRAGLDIWVAGQLLAISRRPEKDAFEPLTLLGALARETRHARLGCMVHAAPYMPPFYLAKALVTLDHLSGGRLEAGLGAGWREEEFRLLDRALPSGRARRAELERTLDAIVELGGPSSLQRPHLPLWVAGRGPRILELVGRRADWANFARGISVADFALAAAAVRAAAVAAGRPPGAVRYSLTGAFLGADDEDAIERTLAARAATRGITPDQHREALRAAGAFVGTPDEIATQLLPYVDAGCEAVVLWPLEPNDPRAPDLLAQLSSSARLRPSVTMKSS